MDSNTQHLLGMGVSLRSRDFFNIQQVLKAHYSFRTSIPSQEASPLEGRPFLIARLGRGDDFITIVGKASKTILSCHNYRGLNNDELADELAFITHKHFPQSNIVIKQYELIDSSMEVPDELCTA
jgi:hypothetical protein